MKVKDVICAAGRSGYMHRDLLAIKSGKAKPNGSLYDGKPMSPGFTNIIEPATIISVMLVLEDGQIAFGDCADVILAGVAGRDPAFNAKGHIDYVRAEVADALRGRDVSKFTDNVAAPWFAPAGLNRGLAGAGIIRADIKLTRNDRDTLYNGRVNPIATFVQQGLKSLRRKAWININFS